MRHHDRQFRKVDRDVVDQHRVAVLEAHAAAAAHARADPAVPGVEQHGQPRRLDDLVERVDPRIVRLELLQRRVQLEAARSGGDEPLRLRERPRPAHRVDARERDEDVRVRRRRGEHVVVRHRGPSGQPFVDGEEHARHAPLAIVRRDRVERERHAGRAEVAPRGGGRVVRLALLGVRVDVDVDRAQRVDVEGGRHRRSSSWQEGCLTELFEGATFRSSGFPTPAWRCVCAER